MCINCILHFTAEKLLILINCIVVICISVSITFSRLVFLKEKWNFARAGNSRDIFLFWKLMSLSAEPNYGAPFVPLAISRIGPVYFVCYSGGGHANRIWCLVNSFKHFVIEDAPRAGALATGLIKCPAAP